MEVSKLGQGRHTGIDITMKENVIQNSEYMKNSQEQKNNKDEKITEQKLNNSIDKLNKFLEDDKVHAEYEVHDKLKDVMIKIVKDDTKEVIMEIPPKKILDMVAKMCEMVGVLIDKKA